MSPIKFFLCLVVSATLSACATQYKPDLTNKPQANVRMLSNLHRITWAAVLNEGCIPQTTFGWESSTQQIGIVTAGEKPFRESIGMPLPPIPDDAAYVETTIPAGEPVALSFSTIGVFHSMACGAGLIFTATEGSDYQITYQRKSGFDCSIELHAIHKNESGEVILEPVNDKTLASKC